MFNFKRIYGEALIQRENFDEQNGTIKLQYYQTKGKNCKEKQYGVGIISTKVGNNELNEEKQEYNNIFEGKEQANNVLKILLENKVTPIDLKYVLEDMAVQN